MSSEAKIDPQPQPEPEAGLQIEVTEAKMEDEGDEKQEKASIFRATAIDDHPVLANTFIQTAFEALTAVVQSDTCDKAVTVAAIHALNAFSQELVGKDYHKIVRPMFPIEAGADDDDSSSSSSSSDDDDDDKTEEKKDAGGDKKEEKKEEGEVEADEKKETQPEAPRHRVIPRRARSRSPAKPKPKARSRSRSHSRQRRPYRPLSKSIVVLYCPRHNSGGPDSSRGLCNCCDMASAIRLWHHVKTERARRVILSTFADKMGITGSKATDWAALERAYMDHVKNGREVLSAWCAADNLDNTLRALKEKSKRRH